MSKNTHKIAQPDSGQPTPVAPAPSTPHGVIALTPTDPTGTTGPAATEQAHRPQLDLQAFQAQMEALKGKRSKAYWRGLEELAETPEFEEVLQREFPRGAAEWLDPMSRRNFLKLMGASLALAGVTGCTRQADETIMPYTNLPENVTPGLPQYYASAMPHAGLGYGLVVKSHMGRPIKIEGNPQHPISQGSTDIFAQGTLLNLYDPERSQVVLREGAESSWQAFEDWFGTQAAELRANGGSGLGILLEPFSSQLLTSQVEQLLDMLPNARIYQYSPLNRDNAHIASLRAFGEATAIRYNFADADVVLALDADFLNSGPGWQRNARDYIQRRRIWEGELNRLYVVEGTATTTGSMADHRLAVRPSAVEAMTRLIAQRLGLDVAQSDGLELTEQQTQFIDALVADLQANAGSSLVLVGDEQPPAVHMLAHAINDMLGNVGSTVEYTDNPIAFPVAESVSMRSLVNAMNAQQITTLLIMESNPVFTAPADLDFAAALDSVPTSIHLGLYNDETGQRCTWHLPQTHFLEMWGDVRAADGTASIIQPLIAPLYNARSPYQLLATLLDDGRSVYAMLRDLWGLPGEPGDYNAEWQQLLNDGVVPDSAYATKELTASLDQLPDPQPVPGGLEITFRADPSLWDGRYANNGWLQELPNPLTKLTWDNAALISPTTALTLLPDVSDLGSLDPQAFPPDKYSTLNGANGRMLTITSNGQQLEIPLWVMPGQPDNTITLHLGNGHQNLGVVADGSGFNAYALRTSDAPWIAPATASLGTGSYQLVSTQMHYSMEGRAIIRAGTVETYEENPNFVDTLAEFEPAPEKNMFAFWEYEDRAWGMVVDLNACVGCNACVVACQAENNIPVIGKREVSVGREMHWIRIDRYYGGELEDPVMYRQPMMCQHCEQAPCEIVCPVAATVHDHEGLNLMVYNRCVGTKYCSNNCPYKVRRFNFLWYSDDVTPSYKLMRNPDVTVRSRGVMEKCTYCLQRIKETTQRAKLEDREVEANEILTACQQVCPTTAIVFGDINNPDSDVTRLRELPLNYAVLGEFNLFPRTTYLGRIVNRNPALGGGVGIEYNVEHHAGGHGDEGHGDEGGMDEEGHGE